MTGKAGYELTIRPLRRKDAGAVSKMMSELAAFHGDKSIITAQHVIAYCLGAHCLSKAWVVFNYKEPAGFAVTYDWMNFVRAKPVRTLDLLYVKECFRGQGMGQALLAVIAKDALEKGFLRFDASAAKHNRRANAFYKRLGFEKRPAAENRYKIEGKALVKLTKKKKT